MCRTFENKSNNLSSVEGGASGALSDYLGEYTAIFAGYTSDPKRRIRVASGGLATTLLGIALHDKVVDGVAVVRADFSDGKVGYKFNIITDPEMLSEYGSSVYFDIPIEKHWKELAEFPGKVALCSLPCHTRIMKNMKENKRRLMNVELFVSLFCGHNNKIELMRFVLDKEGIKEADVSDMWFERSYLGGKINLLLRDGSNVIIPFRHFNIYRSLWFFSKPMCRYCDDHLGLRADISVGDLYIKEYRELPTKHSAVIARTPLGLNIIKSAIDKEAIVVHNIDPETVFRAQKRIIVPSRDGLSRYLACRLLGYTSRTLMPGRFRIRSFLTFFALLLNDRFSRISWGPAVLKRVPRVFLYLYIAAIKIINNTLRG